MRSLGMMVATLAVVATPVLAVTQWQMEPVASKLTWVATFNKQPVTGEFKNWTAEIAFDETDLAASRIKVNVQLGSVESGDADRDGTLKGVEFFNIAATPVAVFESKDIRKTAQGYEAVGTLTLAGVSKPQVLPFELDIAQGIATAQGKLTLSRASYGVGKGQWAKSTEIGDAVEVTFTVKAKARP